MKLSIRNDQRGIGAVVVVVVVVVLAGIGFAGWKLTQKDNVTKNATPAQKAAISECDKIYHDKDLCKFASNADFEKLSYKMTITTTGASAGTLTMLNDGKGNTQLSGTGGGSAFDTISLNNTTYLKDSTDNAWFKFPPTDTTAPKEDNPASSVKLDNTFTAAAAAQFSYKKLGKEACGSLTCFKYQFIDKTQPNSTQYVWFDTKDYRMQHFYMKDATSSTDMVIVYQAVKITAPSPTKDFGASAGAAAGSNDAAAQAAAEAAAAPAASGQ